MIQGHTEYLVATSLQWRPITSLKTKRLIELLQKQVALDGELRNAKILMSQMSAENKWTALKSVLDKKGIALREEEIHQEFEPTVEEHNPFFSVSESTHSIEQLATKYSQSVLFWKEHIFPQVQSPHLEI